MSRLKPSTSNRKFWLIAGGIIVISGAALASLWPVALAYSRTESRHLSDEAARASGAEAEVDYHLAFRLDHGNAEAALHFATAQLAADQPAAALKTVSGAGEGSAVLELRIKALLELDRVSEAVAAADHLVAGKPTDAEITIAALAYGVGEKGSALLALEPRVSSPEALQHVRRAEDGHLPLAADLYATGLLRSSSVLLMKLPASKLSSLYLGRINFHRHTQASLVTAADYYASAVALDPSDIQTRTEYVTVLTDLDRGAEADKQRQLIAKLAAGTP